MRARRPSVLPSFPMFCLVFLPSHYSVQSINLKARKEEGKEKKERKGGKMDLPLLSHFLTSSFVTTLGRRRRRKRRKCAVPFPLAKSSSPSPPSPSPDVWQHTRISISTSSQASARPESENRGRIIVVRRQLGRAGPGRPESNGWMDGRWQGR